MTRGPKKAEEIITNELCVHGCGQPAKFKNKSGKITCCYSANSCPEVKRKNREGVSSAHKEGKMNSSFGENRDWRKGLLKETDNRVLNQAISLKSGHASGRLIPTGCADRRYWTEENRQKQRLRRLSVIMDGAHDSSGRKGHRGYYDNMYFHSSWELAYYVWSKEFLKTRITRNFCLTIEYNYNDRTYSYVPDFIDEEGMPIEIKGYLFSDRDKAKFLQTKDTVKYLFKEDIKPCLAYCLEKYGVKFWTKLYG